MLRKRIMPRTKVIYHRMALATAFFLVALGLGACRTASPEKQIEKQMQALLADFQKMEPGALLRLAGQATRLTDYFTPELELEGFRGLGHLEGKDALRAALVSTANAFGPVRIHSLRWVSLDVAGDGQSARGELIVRGSSPREAGTAEMTVTVDWQRVDRSWLLHRAVVTQGGRF